MIWQYGPLWDARKPWFRTSERMMEMQFPYILTPFGSHLYKTSTELGSADLMDSRKWWCVKNRDRKWVEWRERQ